MMMLKKESLQMKIFAVSRFSPFVSFGKIKVTIKPFKGFFVA